MYNVSHWINKTNIYLYTIRYRLGIIHINQYFGGGGERETINGLDILPHNEFFE